MSSLDLPVSSHWQLQTTLTKLPVFSACVSVFHCWRSSGKTEAWRQLQRCSVVHIHTHTHIHTTHTRTHTHTPRQKNWNVSTGKKNFNPTAIILYLWNTEEMRIRGRAVIFWYTELLKAFKEGGTEGCTKCSCVHSKEVVSYSASTTPSHTYGTHIRTYSHACTYSIYRGLTHTD